MDAAPLIGRAEAMAAVRAAVTRAAQGSGGVLLVVGEAGVGKSRLLTEAARLARGDRMQVLSGRATESGGAYRPLIEALLRGGADDLDPGAVPAPYRAALGRLLPGWAGRRWRGPEASVDPVLVLGEAVVRVLDALVGGPCLLVLEDLHWADADTLALLEYLADRLPDRPVLVAASARDDEPGSAAVDRLSAPRVHTVRAVPAGPGGCRGPRRLTGRRPVERGGARGARRAGRRAAAAGRGARRRGGARRRRDRAVRRPAIPFRGRWPRWCAAGSPCSIPSRTAACVRPPWPAPIPTGSCSRRCSGSRRTPCSPPPGPPRTPPCSARTPAGSAGGTR